MSITATFIESVEGRKYQAYLDGGGVPTIGVGHTGPEVHLGLTWTEMQVNLALAADIVEAEAGLKKLVTVPLNEQQSAALVSFIFNLGEGQLAHSSHLLPFINARNWIGAAKEILRFDHDNGVEVKGLLIRRLKEAVLFLGGS